MSYCQNCGTEVNGNFCSNCGSAVNAVNVASNISNLYGKPVRENTTVKSCYKTFHVVLGSIMWLYGASITAIVIGALISMAVRGDLSFGILVACSAMLVFPAIFFFIGYFPAIRYIRKNTAKDEISKTIKSFVFKTIIGMPAFAVSFVGCAFIVGIILRVWRIAGKAFSPKPCNYTAFIDGEKVSVTRLVDTEFSSYDNIRYIYMDREGNLYRETMFS